MILINNINIRDPTDNIYLGKIKRRKIEAISNSVSNLVSNTNAINRFFSFDNFIIIEKVDFELIEYLKRVFECSFIPDTVFKYVLNGSFIGLKCMVIKQRDEILEYSHPDKHLEWDTLYSECMGDFHIVYFLYNPTFGKMYLKIGNKSENIKEIASGIEINKGNTIHINTCIHIFRKMYVNKIFVL